MQYQDQKDLYWFGEFKLKRNTPNSILYMLNQIQYEIIENYGTLNSSVFQYDFSKQEFLTLISWTEGYFGQFFQWSRFSTKIRCSHQILIEVSQITFKNLLRLEIENSRVINIQFLSWMYCPNLKGITISTNFISSLKPFAKINFSKSSYIEIKNNLYSDMQMEYLFRLKTTKSYLNFLFLNQDVQFRQGQYINQLFKIQVKELLGKQQIQFSFPQPKIAVMFQKRFGKLK